MVDGIAQKPIEGVSMAYTFDQANADAPSTHHTQYFEMLGNRGIYHDGWYANTLPISAPWELAGIPNPDVMNAYKWELYDLSKDWTQNDDLADANPAKLKEMQDLFLVEAAKYQVFPLDNALATRMVTPRPSVAAGRSVFTYSGVLTGTPNGDAPPLLDSSYTIKAEVEVPEGGGDGMLATQGGRFAGWGFYLLKGKPVYVWNLLDLKRVRWEGKEALTPGKHTLEFDFAYDGLGIATLAFNSTSGIGRSGTGVLKVDGKEVAREKMEHTIPLILQWDENFDVGADTLTGVDDRDYQPPFPFNGTLEKLTITIDRPQLTPEDIKKLEAALPGASNRSSE
jgi:arylsulfatase